MRKNKKLLLIVIVAILAVSIPVTLALIHQGQEPSDGGVAEVPGDTPTDEPEVPPTTPSPLAILSAAAGNVSVMNGGTDSWTGAQVGMSLETGDSVKTGDSSSADITFLDGSTIELEANTEIEIASLDISDTGSKTIRLKQVIGNTISRVEKLVDSASSYEIETPACVAAVRGSVMLVNVIGDGTTWVTNQEGDIWVIVDGVELQIPEGRKCIIISGQPPKLVPIIGGGGGGGFSPNPDIAITKEPNVTQAHEGDTITYTYTVTNPGNVPLSSVSVTDNRIGNIPYQSGDTNGNDSLDMDETWIFTATYNITDADDVSPLVNTAAAAGTYSGVGTIIAWTTASVDILRPDIAVTKTAQPTEAYVGDIITYTYTVTNPGNTPLSNVSVVDNKAGDAAYQDGDANEDSNLDTDETWVFTATYTITAADNSPLVNTATASGTDDLSRTATAQDTASVDILQPGVVSAYIGYEYQEGGDFDYNDFGMNMFIEEVYVDDCLTEINMEFESLTNMTGGSHDIHIRRKLSPSTSYNCIITRSAPLPWPEAPGVTGPLGWGSFDITLFNTSYVTSGATVKIHIEITSGCEPYDPAPEPPRWDLAPIFANYDLYMNDRATDHERHIGDWQLAVPPLPTEEYEVYNVPYILVVPVTDWEAPAEGQCITDLYPHFAEYYATESPEDWYE